MARTGAWTRATNYATVSDYSGYLEMATFIPGQTVDRTLWAWNASFTLAETSAFPPGGSLVRVGLWAGPSLAEPPVVPLPVSVPDAEWMDMMTCPWRGGIATSVDIDYLGFIGFGAPDRESKARRRNDTEDVMSLYVCWESVFAQDVGEAYAFYPTAAVDAYVLNPPEGS